MGVTTFDTLKFLRRLEQAGVPSEQAEAQAEVLTEAFNVNLEELVTKDYLAVQFAEQNAAIGVKFARQDARIDSRFSEQEARIEALFASHKAQTDTLFARQEAKFEKRFAEQDGKFNLVFWMLGLVILGVVIPLVERLVSIF